jgi:hypothetical protein
MHTKTFSETFELTLPPESEWASLRIDLRGCKRERERERERKREREMTHTTTNSQFLIDRYGSLSIGCSIEFFILASL